jgi:UrcA family protein
MRTFVLTTLAAATVLAGAPAFAQTVDELTVTGHTLGQRPQHLSAAVSFADLDLTRHDDRVVLRHRVSLTARDLCDKLNEARPSGANLGHSCEEVAIRDAMGRVRLAYADARSPAYAEVYGDEASATVADNAPVGAGPIPDTPHNRALYGGPMSRAGQRTGTRGN